MHACDYNPIIEFVDTPITLEDKLKAISYNIPFIGVLISGVFTAVGGRIN